MLRPRFYLDLTGSYDRNVDLPRRSERHFRRIEIEKIVEVRAVAFEPPVGFGNRKVQVEIAVPVNSLVPLAPDFHRHGIFYSSGNVDALLGFENHVAFAAAFRARMFDDLSVSMAFRARYRLFDDSENRLHALSDPSGSRAIGASLRFAPLFGTRSRAIGANVAALVGDFLASALDGLFEARLHPNFDVVADLPSPSGSAGLETASEKRFENIGKIEVRRKSSSGKTGSFGLSGSVIGGLFRGVRKRGVRFVHLLEFGLFLLVSAVSIGMKFHRLFSIGLFYLFGRSPAGNPENVVKFESHAENLRNTERKTPRSERRPPRKEIRPPTCFRDSIRKPKRGKARKEPLTRSPGFV